MNTRRGWFLRVVLAVLFSVALPVQQSMAARLQPVPPPAPAPIGITLNVCGDVTAFTAATATATGIIIIGLVPHIIGVGTHLNGEAEIAIGARMCLSATLNLLGTQIISGSIDFDVNAELHVCGTVTAVAAASVTINGVVYPIAIGAHITGTLAVGLRICLDAHLNTAGQIAVGVVTPDGSNSPPVINAPGGTQQVTVGQTLTVTVSASDPNAGDTVTISATGLPPGATFPSQTGNPVTGTLTFTPTAGQANQNITVTITATDNHTTSVTANITIHVNPAGGGNQPPSITAPGAQTATVGQTLTFTISASDPNAGNTVTLTAGSVPSGASFPTATGNPATGTFTFTPTAGQANQDFSVTFTATDNNNASTTANVAIHVNPGGGGNQPPTISVPGAQTATVGQTLTFTVSGSDPNAGNTVTLTASGVPAGASFPSVSGNPVNGTFTFTPTAGQANQSFTVTFTATDNSNATATGTVTINVQAGGGGNQPPTISVPGPQTATVGQTLTFTVTATDPNAGNTVTLSASNVPSGASFPTASGNPVTGTFTFTPTAGQANTTFSVTFTATDNNNGTATATVPITVQAGGGGGGNQAPTVTVPGPQTAVVGQTLTFGVSASDPNSGDTVSLSASNLPAGASASPNPATGNPATLTVSFTPTAAQAGQTYTVNFSANDGHGGTASGSVQIVVNPGAGGNHAPALSVPGAQTLQAGQNIAFTVSASDQDNGDTVTLTASGVPNNATFTPSNGNPATGAVSFTPSQNQVGQTFMITFTATDNHGAVATGTVAITVTAGGGGGNQPPSIGLDGPQSGTVGQPLTVTVTATDPNAGDTVSLTASNVPLGGSFTAQGGNPATGTFVFTPTAAQAGQTFTVIITAVDNHGASATATITIVVNGGGGGGNDNHSPVVSAPQTVEAEVGAATGFLVTATDPDGDSVTLRASGLPSGAAFNPATGAFTFTPSANQIGQNIAVTFTATDTHGATGSVTTIITVVASGSGSQAPIISLPPSPISTTVGTPLMFDVPANSPVPNCQVTVTATGLPAGATFVNGQFSFTPTADQANQSFTVTFKAADCQNNTTSGSVVIVVLPGDGGGNGDPIACQPVKKIVYTPTVVGSGCGVAIIHIENTGDGPLSITRMTMLVGTQFHAVQVQPLPWAIQPGGAADIKITFVPTDTGIVKDTITFLTNDPENPTIKVQLVGKGIR